jgi:hypothetical protein
VKVCTKCGQEKDESEFATDRQKKDGLTSRCKSCIRAVNSSWKSRNPEKHKQINREWKAKNADRVKESSAEWYENNKERKQETYREWAKANKDKINERKKERRDTDPVYALQHVLRARVNGAFRLGGYRKTAPLAHLLGCSFEALLAHLGPRPEGAHLDHLVPCAQAHDEEELRKLQHYTNLRWLSAEDNLKKSDKKTHEGEELCRKLLGREWID